MSIADLVKEQNIYHREVVPLIASENVTSLAVDFAAVSDLSHRYAEGLPGKRHYPGCKIVDKIEREAVRLMQDLFGAPFVDLRPLSGTQANLILYTAFTNPGDTIMRMATGKGGHISAGSRRLGGTAGTVRGLDCATFAFDEEEFNIDVDETLKIYNGLCKVGKVPKLALFGASVFLFPHPIRELKDEFIANGTIIGYDAAHVAGLIAGKEFQDPFEEGAQIITMSTHKTFFGPQHGAILSIGPDEFNRKIQRATFPANVSNHHLGAMAGVGIAASELIKYGKEYAGQTIRNAKTLAETLHKLGLKVVGNGKQFTESHQVLLDVSDIGGAKAERRLEEAGILANKNLLPWDRRFGRTVWNPGGIRIGVQEVTRLGMTEANMEFLGKLIQEALSGGTSSRIRKTVKFFMENFGVVKYV